MTQLNTLQAVRALAALAVVVFHINSFVLPAALYDGDAMPTALNMGYAGVEFFFALSGFIMVYVHRKDFDQPDRFGRFALKRVIRIFPLFWAIAIPLALAALASSSIGPEGGATPLSILGLFTLTSIEGWNVLEVAWTLQFELIFYLMFGLAILSGRYGLIALGLWFAACVAALAFAPLSGAIGFLASPYNLIFLFGMISAALYTRISRSLAWGLIGAGLLLFFATGLSDVYGAWPLNEAMRTLAFGLGAALTISGLTAAESRGGIRVTKPLILIGDSSYALYLVHMPVLTVVIPIILKLGLPSVLPAPVMGFLLTAGCILAGLITHALIEKPLIRLASQHFLPSRTAAKAVAG